MAMDCNAWALTNWVVPGAIFLGFVAVTIGLFAALAENRRLLILLPKEPAQSPPSHNPIEVPHDYGDIPSS